MRSPTESLQRRKLLRRNSSLRKNEEGAALLEGCLSLIIFLPTWAFIIHIGSSAVAMVDVYQAARTATWQNQASGNCGNATTIGTGDGLDPGSLATPGGGSGNATFGIEYENAALEPFGYADFFGGGDTVRHAQTGCANYPPFTGDPPSFDRAVQSL